MVGNADFVAGIEQTHQATGIRAQLFEGYGGLHTFHGASIAPKSQLKVVFFNEILMFGLVCYDTDLCCKH